MSARRLKLPPYSKLLSQQLADRQSWRKYDGTSPNGEHVSLWVIMGPQAWKVAKDGEADIQFSALGSGGPWEGHRLFLLLPPGADPYQYDWSQLAIGGPVLVCQAGDVSQSELHQLADALLQAGITSVIADSPSGLIRYTYQRRAA